MLMTNDPLNEIYETKVRYLANGCVNLIISCMSETIQESHDDVIITFYVNSAQVMLHLEGRWFSYYDNRNRVMNVILIKREDLIC